MGMRESTGMGRHLNENYTDQNMVMSDIYKYKINFKYTLQALQIKLEVLYNYLVTHFYYFYLFLQ